MSPREMQAYETDFSRAIKRLGWSWREVERDHDRDDRSWTEEVMVDREGRFLIDLSGLSEAMVREIIRIALDLPS